MARLKVSRGTEAKVTALDTNKTAVDGTIYLATDTGKVYAGKSDGTLLQLKDGIDHTYSSLKNPYALTIQGNGTTLTNGTYDGSAAKTVNITKSSIGLDSVDNTADSAKSVKYATSAGSATSATSAGKWSTARTITLAGDTSGSVSIDGSTNVTLTETNNSLANRGVHAETASGTTGNAATTGMLDTSEGMYLTESYNDTKVMPASYGNVINIVGAGTGQIMAEWSGSDNVTGHLYYRSHRDTTTGGWSSWKKVTFKDDISTSTTSVGSASSWSAGSVPTLGTAIAADDITAWSAGSTPTLGTAIAADDITSWSAGTASSASFSGGVLTFNNSTVPSLSYTARSIPNVTSVGSVPSLSYTARSIPNVTSVGTAPSLTITSTSVVKSVSVA